MKDWLKRTASKTFSRIALDLLSPARERMKEEHMLMMGQHCALSIIESFIRSLCCPEGRSAESIGTWEESSQASILQYCSLSALVLSCSLPRPLCLSLTQTHRGAAPTLFHVCAGLSTVSCFTKNKWRPVGYRGMDEGMEGGIAYHSLSCLFLYLLLWRRRQRDAAFGLG